MLVGDVFMAINRTGHDIKDINTIMSYILGNSKTNEDGGLILAGYNKKCQVFSSDLKVIINDDYKDAIAGIKKELFDTRVLMTDTQSEKCRPSPVRYSAPSS